MITPNKTEKIILTIVISITFGFIIGVMAQKHQSIYRECEHYHQYDNYQCEEMIEHLEIMTMMMDNELKEKNKLEKELILLRGNEN